MIDALYCRSKAVLLAMHVWLYVVAVLYMVSDAGRPHGVLAADPTPATLAVWRYSLLLPGVCDITRHADRPDRLPRTRHDGDVAPRSQGGRRWWTGSRGWIGRSTR